MNDAQRERLNAIQRENLTSLRVTAQLTQTQLSRKLGRPQSYVSKYEAGERKLTLIEVREIVLLCGANLSEFVETLEHEITLTMPEQF
jgi:transcriptional regulator with XRE-family HTH domain